MTGTTEVFQRYISGRLRDVEGMQAEFEGGGQPTRSCRLVHDATEPAEPLVIGDGAHELWISSVDGQDNERSPGTGPSGRAGEQAVIFISNYDVAVFLSVRKVEAPSLDDVGGYDLLEQLDASMRVVKADKSDSRSVERFVHLD